MTAKFVEIPKTMDNSPKSSGCFYCKNMDVPIDWYREIKEYACEKCAKKKRLA